MPLSIHVLRCESTGHLLFTAHNLLTLSFAGISAPLFILHWGQSLRRKHWNNALPFSPWVRSDCEWVHTLSMLSVRGGIKQSVFLKFLSNLTIYSILSLPWALPGEQLFAPLTEVRACHSHIMTEKQIFKYIECHFPLNKAVKNKDHVWGSGKPGIKSVYMCEAG